MLPANLLNLLAVCLLSLTTPSVTSLRIARDPADALRLLSRQNGQCTAGYSACNNGTPANFCCPSDQQCVVFNDKKSVICCPKGKDCNKIAPINCDMQKQNATKSPNSGIHSTDLTGSLAKCGDSGNCCPNGYSCKDGNCVSKEQSPSKASSTSSSTSSPTASSTPTSKPSATSTSTPTALPNTVTKSQQFPPGAVAAGLFAGLALGVAITVVVICLLGRRARKKNPPQKPESIFSSYIGPPSISDPIPHYQQNGELRNDFLRRDPNATASPAPYGRNRAGSRVRSLFSRSPTFSRNNQGYGEQRSPDGVGRTLQTPMQTPPPSNLRREPSTESIKIYSPPNDGLAAASRDNSTSRPATTFSNMMRQANLQEGNYLGYNGRS